MLRSGMVGGPMEEAAGMEASAGDAGLGGLGMLLSRKRK